MGIVFGKIDVECASYIVLKTVVEGIELRRYASCVAVETPCARMDGRDGAFGRLASYIGVFGTPANRNSQAIAMTAPVITNSSSGSAIAMTAPVLSTGNVMSFILPSSIRDVSEAPIPLDPQVTLRQIPQRDIAALTFWGNCDADTADSYAKQLFTTLQTSNIVPATAAMPPHLLARYNPPFTIWFMKKNEVLIDVGTYTGTCDSATT